MKLKVYADRMSQPSRAVIIFCKVNGIDFEEVRIDLTKDQQYTPEYREISPFRKVPAVVDGRFKLFESHAIFVYLASVFPGVADHWYPADVFKRAKIQSVLDWHHLNVHRGAAEYCVHAALAPWLGKTLNPQAAAESKKILSSTLWKIESFWLKGRGQFLLGWNQPSVADLSLVCEIMQLEVLDEEDRNGILGPLEKVKQWIEDTRNATRPYFDEVHSYLFKFKARMQKQRPTGSESDTQSSLKTTLHSKI